MRSIKLFQVDTFTDSIFGGNPAGVILSDVWLTENQMQLIANENNLAETAFIIPQKEDYKIRWFTPEIEVQLCGHATLAAGFVLKKMYSVSKDPIRFHSNEKGILEVSENNEKFYLNFPSDKLNEINLVNKIGDAIGCEPKMTLKGETDLIAVLKDEESVRFLSPDFKKIAALGGRGLIVTSKGEKVDFVSRFFAPQTGVNEDYVTGSAHTSLIPFWSEKLNKIILTASQVSKRVGFLDCEYLGERVVIGGKAQLYMKAEIYLPN